MIPTDISRRRFVRQTVVVACAGMLVPHAPLLGANGVLHPPGPMLLSRIIERELSDGEVLSIRRTWQVGFSSQGRGIAVTGKQLDASVDAPAKLGALARLEQQRDTHTMWPILLSEDGVILAAGEYASEEDVNSAVQVAKAMIAQRARSGQTKARDMNYISELQRASSSLLDQLPPDLFFPQIGDQSFVKPVALPEGIEGEFSLHYSAETAEGAQWMANARRKIVTRIGDTSRASSDTWKMAEL